MTYRLIFTENYIKRARKFLKQHTQISSQYKKIFELLELNPHHPSLKNHALKGNLKGLLSISINMSYRIVLHLMISEKDIILIDIGTYDQVY